MRLQRRASRDLRQPEPRWEDYAPKPAGGAPEAIEWFVREALGRSTYPDWYPREDRQYKVAYRPRSSEAFVELALPPAAVIPAVRRYYYDTGRAVGRELPIPAVRAFRHRVLRFLAAEAGVRQSPSTAWWPANPGPVTSAEHRGRSWDSGRDETWPHRTSSQFTGIDEFRGAAASEALATGHRPPRRG